MRLSAILLLILGSVGAAGAAVTVNDLAALTHADGLGNTLPYRLFTPSGRGPGRTFPLVLFLHGAGGRGSDNTGQISDQPIALALCHPDHQADWPCFVVAPQCPAGQTWAAINAGDDWNPAIAMPATPTWPLAAAKAVVDQLLAANADIDPAQVHVVGWSMGGYGSWEAAARWPAAFRKLVPICGGGDSATAPLIADKPIWAFHAANDAVVPVARSQAMVAAVRAAGGDPLYTEYPTAMGIGHAAWTPAFSDPELFPWLFGRARTPTHGGDGLAAAYRNVSSLAAPFADAVVATGFISRPDFDYGTGSPATGVNADYFSARFTSMLLPPVTGIYSFRGTANESVTLYVNSVQLFVPTSLGTGSISLTAGAKVPIQIDLVEGTGSSQVLIEWLVPGAGAYVGVPRDVLFSGAGGVARPAPPSDLVASVAGTDVALAWADRSDNEAGFTIDHSTDGLAWTTVITVAANATTHTVGGLAAGTRYRFRVRGTNGSGLSPYGPVVQALTGAAGGGGVAGAPAFTPAGGSYAGAQTVTIVSATSGAAIHYTTDGATPTAVSPLYAAPVTVAASATLKAVARKTGLGDSPVASATYVIAGGSPSTPGPVIAASSGCGLGAGAAALALLLGLAGIALGARGRALAR